MVWLSVLVGGALGSGARHAVNIGAARFFGGPSALGTAAVNLIGSFVIGALAGALAAHRLAMSTHLRVFVFIGILGGFTTFSSLMLDSLVLAERDVGRAAVNMAGQVVIGFGLVWLGYWLGLHARLSR